MTRLLTYPLAAFALLSGGVSLVAWGVLDHEPRRGLYGTRPTVRAMIRHALGLDRVATGGAPL